MSPIWEHEAIDLVNLEKQIVASLDVVIREAVAKASLNNRRVLLIPRRVIQDSVTGTSRAKAKGVFKPLSQIPKVLDASLIYL